MTTTMQMPIIHIKNTDLQAVKTETVAFDLDDAGQCFVECLKLYAKQYQDRPDNDLVTIVLDGYVVTDMQRELGANKLPDATDKIYQLALAQCGGK